MRAMCLFSIDFLVLSLASRSGEKQEQHAESNWILMIFSNWFRSRMP